MDFFFLLYRELDKKDKEDRTSASWVPRFWVYVGMISQSQSGWVPLFQHFDIIYKWYTKFTGPAWLQYDKDFAYRQP